MKKVFQKISALLLALLVVLATSSLSFSTHFCGEQLIAYSFTDSVKTCSSTIASKAIKKITSVSKKSCCSNKHIEKKAQNELLQKKDPVDFDVTKSLLHTQFHFVNDNFEYVATQTNVPFLNYSPPLLLRDRSVLFQVFRI
ncbi:HYC_CC_PP family protein [Aquimarina agarilytica]|uniref:HYC_CC_PP family protein n=1 Tax=Aquimarina agarilytica TaxID=1087449 RepID=UPI000288C92D|nr:hypothetical protein [Aquimarina agarilytica]